jgi:spore maturation protein CgeB
MKVLIVGNRDGTNVGGALERAAAKMNVEVRTLESRLAMQAPQWLRRANWWLRGRRPTRLRAFSDLVAEQCHAWRPDCLLCVGIAPVDRRALNAIGRLGIPRLDYLTDDPWNPAHRANWFLDALGGFDIVFSPRRSNLDDLRGAGVRRASFLPFAYCPDLHFPESIQAGGRGSDDLVFAGGCDRDRVPVIASIIDAGFRVGLYGILWERHEQTRKYTRGQADPRTLRLAHSEAKVALCLPRRANRDGHTMRTFEVAAMGACVLAEYTDEQRDILGDDHETVAYFRSSAEMLDKLRWLVSSDDERTRLGSALLARIRAAGNTYQDRLQTMLSMAAAAS